MKRLATALTLTFFAAPLAAETAYVTDQLRLGIHAAPDTSDAAFASLLSGEKVEILEQNIYYARVRMEDGRVGWVRKTYLVPDPPAVRRVDTLQKERDELAATAKRLQDDVIDTRTRLKELEARLENAGEDTRSEATQIRELKKDNNELVQRLARYESSLPLGWVILLTVVMLLVGSLFGWWVTDYRSRKRHGGFRI